MVNSGTKREQNNVGGQQHDDLVAMGVDEVVRKLTQEQQTDEQQLAALQALLALLQTADTIDTRTDTINHKNMDNANNKSFDAADVVVARVRALVGLKTRSKEASVLAAVAVLLCLDAFVLSNQHPNQQYQHIQHSNQQYQHVQHSNQQYQHVQHPNQQYQHVQHSNQQYQHVQHSNQQYQHSDHSLRFHQMPLLHPACVLPGRDKDALRANPNAILDIINTLNAISLQPATTATASYDGLRMAPIYLAMAVYLNRIHHLALLSPATSTLYQTLLDTIAPGWSNETANNNITPPLFARYAQIAFQHGIVSFLHLVANDALLPRINSRSFRIVSSVMAQALLAFIAAFDLDTLPDSHVILNLLLTLLTNASFIPTYCNDAIKDLLHFLLSVHPLSISYSLRLISACASAPALFTDLYDILLSYESSLAQDAAAIIGNDVIIHGENVHARNTVTLIPGINASVCVPANTHGIAIRDGHLLSHRKPIVIWEAFVSLFSCLYAILDAFQTTSTVSSAPAGPSSNTNIGGEKQPEVAYFHSPHTIITILNFLTSLLGTGLVLSQEEHSALHLLIQKSLDLSSEYFTPNAKRKQNDTQIMSAVIDLVTAYVRSQKSWQSETWRLVSVVDWYHKITHVRTFEVRDGTYHVTRSVMRLTKGLLEVLGRCVLDYTSGNNDQKKGTDDIDENVIEKVAQLVSFTADTYSSMDAWKFQARERDNLINAAVDVFLTVLDVGMPSYLAVFSSSSLSSTSSFNENQQSRPGKTGKSIRLFSQIPRRLVSLFLYDGNISRLKPLLKSLQTPSSPSLDFDASATKVYTKSIRFLHALLTYRTIIIHESSLLDVLLTDGIDHVGGVGVLLDVIERTNDDVVMSLAVRCLTQLLYVSKKMVAGVTSRTAFLKKLVSVLNQERTSKSHVKDGTTAATVVVDVYYLCTLAIATPTFGSALFSYDNGVIVNHLKNILRNANEVVRMNPKKVATCVLCLETLWRHANIYRDVMEKVRGDSEFWGALKNVLLVPPTSTTVTICHDEKEGGSESSAVLRVIHARLLSILVIELVQASEKSSGVPDHLRFVFGEKLPWESWFKTVPLSMNDLNDVEVSSMYGFEWSQVIDMTSRYGDHFVYDTRHVKVSEDVYKKVTKFNLVWMTIDAQRILLKSVADIVSELTRDVSVVKTTGLSVDIIKAVTSDIAQQSDAQVCYPTVLELSRVVAAVMSSKSTRSLFSTVDIESCLQGLLSYVCQRKADVTMSELESKQDITETYHALFAAILSSLRALASIQPQSERDDSVRFYKIVEPYFRFVCRLVSMMALSKMAESAVTTCLYATVNQIVGMSDFMGAPKKWTSIMNECGVLKAVNATMSHCFAAANVSLLITLFDIANIMAANDVSVKFLNVICHLVYQHDAGERRKIPEYLSQTTMKNPMHRLWCESVRCFSSVIRSAGDRDATLFAAFLFIDRYAYQIESSLSLHANDNVTMARLEEIEWIMLFFYELSAHGHFWRKHRREILNAYLRFSMQLFHTFTDKLNHPNRFQSTCLPISKQERDRAYPPDGDTTKPSPFLISARQKVYQILLYILMSLQCLTEAVHPFHLPTNEWDYSNMIFTPTLETNLGPEYPTSLGTILLLLDHLRQHPLGSSSTPLHSTPLSQEVWESLVESGFTLLVSQVVYCLSMPTWDARRREHAAMEVGAAVESCLASFIQTFEKDSTKQCMNLVVKLKAVLGTQIKAHF